MFKRVFFCAISVSLFLCLSIANAAEPGLIGYWPLDGDAKDASGNGNDGTVTGNVSYPDGVVGKAAELDGKAKIDCGQAAILQPGPAMSAMFWMRPSVDLDATLPRANILYMAKGPMFAYNKTPAGSEVPGPPGTIRCWAKGTLFTSNAVWKKDVWYHLAYTYDGANSILYEDGKETGKVAATGAIGARTGNLLIGQNFPGAMDEVKLYDRGLSAAEVAGATSALEPAGKLTATWGLIKSIN